MKLPITMGEFEKIMKSLKRSYPSIYNKLWSYKMNYLNKENKDGLS